MLRPKLDFAFCVINFSTFESNNVTLDECLNHDETESGMFHDFLCNIVNNKQGSRTLGIISIQSEVLLENCTILGDYGNGVPFSTFNEKAKLIIINCNLDRLEVNIFYFSATYTASNNHFTNELKTLYHISTRECHAINDIKNANIQPDQDKIYCSIELKPEGTFVLLVYPTFCQLLEQLTFCIIFEIK